VLRLLRSLWRSPELYVLGAKVGDPKLYYLASFIPLKLKLGRKFDSSRKAILAGVSQWDIAVPQMCQQQLSIHHSGRVSRIDFFVIKPAFEIL
jgi:hypothetical protein